jgi:Tfp pilus assembly protein PilF
MHRSFLFSGSILLLLGLSFLATQSCAQSNRRADGTTDTPAEHEIRAGYCDFQRKNYYGAQSHFSKALELDPAQKVWSD